MRTTGDIDQSELSIVSTNHRVRLRPEVDEFSQSVAEFMMKNKLKIDLKIKPTPVINKLQVSIKNSSY